MPGTHIRDLGDVCTCCIECVCGGDQTSLLSVWKVPLLLTISGIVRSSLLSSSSAIPSCHPFPWRAALSSCFCLQHPLPLVPLLAAPHPDSPQSDWDPPPRTNPTPPTSRPNSRLHQTFQGPGTPCSLLSVKAWPSYLSSRGRRFPGSPEGRDPASPTSSCASPAQEQTETLCPCGCLPRPHNGCPCFCPFCLSFPASPFPLTSP